MTALHLPPGIGFTGMTPALLYSGVELEGALGGPSQWKDNPGDRYRMDVSFPEMRMEPKGRELLATLKRARKLGLRVPVPQDGIDTSHPALTFVGVSGGGQSGTSLAVASLPTNYTILAGQFFTLIHDGRGYLHSVATDTTSDASGNAVLPLIEMLRVIPDNGDECLFQAPFIEGYPQGNEQAWNVGLEPYLKPLSIQIKETR